jgi:hypothetical protein
MKKMAAIIFAQLAAMLIAGTCLAGGYCPETADKLEDFKGCMAPMRGAIGTVYRGTAADMNGESHRALLNSMAQTPMGGYYTAYGNPLSAVAWQPIVAVAASKAYHNNPNSAFWSWYMMNNLLYYPMY